MSSSVSTLSSEWLPASLMLSEILVISPPNLKILSCFLSHFTLFDSPLLSCHIRLSATLFMGFVKLPLCRRPHLDGTSFQTKHSSCGSAFLSHERCAGTLETEKLSKTGFQSAIFWKCNHQSGRVKWQSRVPENLVMLRPTSPLWRRMSYAQTRGVGSCSGLLLWHVITWPATRLACILQRFQLFL